MKYIYRGSEYMEQKQEEELIYFQRRDIKKELVIQRLHERGCRMTKQRQILLDIIMEQECASCKEMYYRANAIEPSIGIATVYRLVSLLEDIGAIDRKNMFKISCCMECNKENICMIQFEDDTFCRLTTHSLIRVMAKGLSECGYCAGKKIKSIVLKTYTKTEA